MKDLCQHILLKLLHIFSPQSRIFFVDILRPDSMRRRPWIRSQIFFLQHGIPQHLQLFFQTGRKYRVCRPTMRTMPTGV